MTDTRQSIEDLLSGSSKTKVAGGLTSAQPVSQGGDEGSAEEKLSKKLKEMKVSEDEARIQLEAEGRKIPYIDLTSFPISADALQTVPENICKEQNMVCFLNTGEEIRIATTNPDNPEIKKILDSLEDSLHVKGAIYLTSARNLQTALDQYAKLPKLKARAKGVEVSKDELERFKAIGSDFRKLQGEIEKVNITDLVTLFIAAAIQANASDIHIEAEEADVKIRFRVDGVLHDAASLKKEIWPKVISRIKLLSGLKMNITDKPQDGRFSIILSEGKMDVRVSCTPTTWGESVVMRLLKSSATALQFDDMGLVGKAFTDLKTQVERPNGMIITTGPTGSGKTTTLYAILNKLNTEDIKICTLEDPVEYKLAGINQSQIDHSKGYSFADGLRSLLRQDPDVVMVGEIRDLETADTAINAALTGHLVLSTIHTNSAAGAIPRFLAMGVKPFLLAPALNAMMGQRLVRKICKNCKEEFQLEPETLERVKKLLAAIPDGHPDKPDMSNMKFYHGKGCEVCNGIGYKGRLGIYEILLMSPEIEKMISAGEIAEVQLQEAATKAGMITMVQDGLIKALKGITSVEEVFSVSE